MTQPESDCEDQGATRIEEGCFRCPPEFKQGQPVRPKLVRKASKSGSWWVCERCGGGYGAAS